MDCVIKSSNRPYMLDWCIRSLKERAEGSIGTIFIADDGTPSQYLDEIVSRHPDVILLHSGRYFPDAQYLTRDKSESMEPVFDCWREAVKRCSGDYLLLLEDDIALIRPLNFTLIEKQIRTNKVVHHRLYDWRDEFDQLNQLVDECNQETSFVGRPQFLQQASTSPLFRALLFMQFGGSSFSFLVWRAARHLGIHPRNQWLLNYQVYGVAGNIFSKEWWLQLWEHPQLKIDEGMQMSVALECFLNDRTLNTGYMDVPALTISYRSAARNNETSKQSNFSVDVMNRVLNEAWLQGTFAMGIDDRDLVEEQVLRLFASAGLPNEFGEHWKDWYQTITTNIENIGS